MMSVGADTLFSSLRSISGSVRNIRHILSTTTAQWSGPSGETAAYISRSVGGSASSGMRSSFVISANSGTMPCGFMFWPISTSLRTREGR